MIKLWGRANSINVQKVMWTAGELGLAVERIDLGGKYGGLDTDAFGALNPNRCIPAIQDGALVLWESNAIVRYLAARYGDGSLWPRDPAARAAADKWMDWQITELGPPMRDIFWQYVRTPERERNAKLIADSLEAALPRWRLLDREVSRSAHPSGDRLTMGEIPLGTYLHRWYALPIARPELPHLAAWYARLKERPAYREQVALPLS